MVVVALLHAADSLSHDEDNMVIVAEDGKERLLQLVRHDSVSVQEATVELLATLGKMCFFLGAVASCV